MIREQLAWACDSPWDIGWSVGVRYFRFQESLAFSSVSTLGDYDAYFKDTVTNNLVGVQFGFDAAYNVANCVRLFITPKVGIYSNFLDSTFDAKAEYQAGNYVDGCVNVPGYPNFPAHGTTTGLAFLTQDRRGRRLAVLAELERSRRLSRGGHHRHGLGRRSIPQVHVRHA